jgi:hypothetical protein
VRKILTILTLIAALAAGLAGASPADAAFYNRGVKKVDFQIAYDACIEGLFTCTPNAGEGLSNRMYVNQVDTGSGYTFGDYDTTSIFGDGHLWFAATIGAECRAGYKLDSARIIPGWVYDNTFPGVPQQVHAWSAGISVPDAKTMPSKLIALNVPMSTVFAVDGGLSIVHEFDTLDDVYAYGESVIAQRVASGMSEADARSQGFLFEGNVALSAEVGCAGIVSGNVWRKTMPRYLPLTIEFVGVPKPGAKDQVGGDDLVVPDRVTEVELTVTPSPHDECILYVSGYFRANGDLTAYYRFIDQWGQRSNAFPVELEAGILTVRSHHISIPTADTSPEGPSLVAPTGPGQIGGLVVEDIGKVSGHYQIEVYSPNLIRSNIVGFSVDPCPVPPQADVPEGAPTSPQPPTDGGDTIDGESSDPTPLPPPPPPPTRQPGGLTLG